MSSSFVSGLGEFVSSSSYAFEPSIGEHAFAATLTIPVFEKHHSRSIPLFIGKRSPNSAPVSLANNIRIVITSVSRDVQEQTISRLDELGVFCHYSLEIRPVGKQGAARCPLVSLGIDEPCDVFL